MVVAGSWEKIGRGKGGGGIGESKDWSTRDGGRKTCIMLMVDENEEEHV